MYNGDELYLEFFIQIHLNKQTYDIILLFLFDQII